MNRASPILVIGLLLVICFLLAGVVQPRAARWSSSAEADNLLKLVMGDSRRMFANHFFVQADVSFHGGYYPSIFDYREKPKISAMRAGHDEQAHEREMALDKPHDWIEAFGRHFRITEHAHLEAGQEREMLPWLRISAELDPQRVETYTVASFWLCKHLKKVDEAEQFLREGLRNNPGSCEILYELGRLYAEERHQSDRARNVWNLALTRWNSQELKKKEPNLFLLEQITVHLANLEEEAANFPRAIGLLELAKKASPHPHDLQQRIDELKQKASISPKDR